MRHRSHQHERARPIEESSVSNPTQNLWPPMRSSPRARVDSPIADPVADRLARLRWKFLASLLRRWNRRVVRAKQERQPVSGQATGTIDHQTLGPFGPVRRAEAAAAYLLLHRPSPRSSRAQATNCRQEKDPKNPKPRLAKSCSSHENSEGSSPRGTEKSTTG